MEKVFHMIFFTSTLCTSQDHFKLCDLTQVAQGQSSHEWPELPMNRTTFYPLTALLKFNEHMNLQC